MRHPHKYRLPRKFKKEVKKSGGWWDFIYTRIVAELYPYPVYYNNKPKYFIRKKQGYKFGLCGE